MGDKVEMPEDPTKCMIHKQYDIIAQALHDEMQKDGLDERSFEKILCLIKTAAKLQARIAGKAESQFAQDLIDEILTDTKKVAGHMHGWIAVTTAVITSVVQAAAGIVGGVAAFQGLSVLASAQAQGLVGKALSAALQPATQLGNLGQGIGGVGSALNGGKDVWQNYEGSRRTIAQHRVEEGKRKREASKQEGDRKRELTQEMHRSIEQANSAAHDTFSKMCH